MKAAVVFTRDRDPGPAIRSMLAAQRLRDWHNSGRVECAPGAAGFIATSDRSGSVRMSRTAANGNWLIVTGVPIRLEGLLDRELDECVATSSAQAGERLSQLEGAFAAIHWDSAARTLSVVTDILGMQPLFLYRSRDTFALASDAKALTAAELTPLEMDPASWGAFLSIKHPIAGRTLAKDVQRVPAGTILQFRADAHEMTSRPYWRWPERGPERLEDVDIPGITETFLAELKAYLEHNSQAPLCLSGGFDSRLILAGLAALGKSPDTISLSHADELFDMDGRVAARIARQFGTRFTLYPSDPGYYSSAGYLQYLIDSEVATPSLYLFIAQLCSTLTPSMQAVWEGVFPGCILYPVHQPPGGFDQYLRRECAPLDALPWAAAERVFAADLVRQMRTSFTESLAAERAEYSDDAFGVSQFVVRNRTRQRIAINPLQVYSNDVIPFTPGLSKRFWSLTAGIGYDVRAGHRLYRHLFGLSFPKALNVPAISGTTPYPLNTTLDRDYLLARLGIQAAQRPKLGALLRLAGLSANVNYWQPSTLVDQELEHVDTSHPELSGSGADRVRSARPPYDAATTHARQLLFYWSTWRRVHGGSSVRPREQTVG